MADLWTSKLSEYLDGTLPAADRQAVESHLVDCAECRVVLEDLRIIASEASALTDSPPASDLWQGIAERIATGPTAISDIEGARQRRAYRISLSLPQLLAAGVVLAALSGAVGRFLVSSPADDTTGPSTPGVPALQVAAPGSRLAVDHALTELQQVLEAGRGRLDSTTVRILELNLAIIDRAIEQAQRAVAADPANGYVRDHLAETMRRKLALMRQAADLVETAS